MGIRMFNDRFYDVGVEEELAHVAIMERKGLGEFAQFPYERFMSDEHDLAVHDCLDAVAELDFQDQFGELYAEQDRLMGIAPPPPRGHARGMHW